MKNNIKSLVSKREQIEQEAIDLAVKHGYNNPHEDKSAINALIDGDNRRFITEFIQTVPYELLISNNIKKVVVDKTRCVKELIPNVVEYGLHNPLIVEESRTYPGSYTILSGHNREWCLKKMGFNIPAFVVSENVNLVGDVVSPLSNLRNCVLANVKNLTGQYNTDDAIVHIADAMRLDPTFGGKNPSGKFPPRSSENGEFDFDDVMSEIYRASGWFQYAGTRTRIYNKYLKNSAGQKVTDVSSKDELTLVLTSLGWDLGLRDSGSRKPFVDHIDTKNNSFILTDSDNGRDFEKKVIRLPEKYFNDPSFQKMVDDNNIEHIDIVARCYKPSANKANLDSSRNAYLGRIRGYNKFMQRIDGSPFKIRYVVFPKQIINNPQDVMTKYNLMEEI